MSKRIRKDAFKLKYPLPQWQLRANKSRTTVAFMDHENVPHMLTLEQLKTLHLEILQNGQSAYQQKWSLRTQIEEAQDAGAVESVEIKFNAEDFSATESLTLAKVGV